MDDREPTAWELMRGIQRIDDSLTALNQKILSRDAFTEYRVAVEQRHQVIEASIAAFEAARVKDRAELGERIDGIAEDIAAERARSMEREEEARKMRQGQAFSIFMAFFGPTAAIIVGILIGAN